MRFIASHTTRFRYSGPVFLEPHTIRLRPRSGGGQRLVRYKIEVDPTPEVLTEAVDAEGNEVSYAGFAGVTGTLLVTSEFEVETLRNNPFDYLVLGDGSSQLPVEYPEGLRARLAASLDRSEPGEQSVADFIRPVIARSNGQTLPFLNSLNEEIYRCHHVAVREHGDPMSPGQALRAEQVACRDLAVLFMDCCRAVGIAARFVSGYQEHGSGSDSCHMHAWAEVYLPGGGWRGYDPTHGLAVADRHIAVAASSAPLAATPITGNYRGEAVASPLEVQISIALAAASS